MQILNPFYFMDFFAGLLFDNTPANLFHRLMMRVNSA